MTKEDFYLVGTEYGGWMISPNHVPKNSTIISAGVGEDISFDEYFIKNKNCKIIGIDPTSKSHSYINSRKDIYNFLLIKKALTAVDDDIIKLYKNKNTNHVSESILETHSSVLSQDSYNCETISLEKIFKEYSDISVVKMDIEGAEYEVIQSVSSIPDSVKQFCIEFHHFCTSKTLEDTKTIINIMKKFGFNNFIEKPSTKQLNELTFWRD